MNTLRLSTNHAVAAKLREAADLLELQGANPYRVAAYRKGADTLVTLQRDVAQIADSEGMTGLVAISHIGRGIAAAILEIIATGNWSLLQGLRGDVDPVRLLRSVPGIGPELATRIHEQLHIESLDELERAAHDGRLAGLRGVGDRRLAAIRATLAMRRGRRDTPATIANDAPAVFLLLEIDADYRARAQAGRLRRIAPRRFNPTADAWLPVWHTEQHGWRFTVLYSNTERAHRLQRTRDWVVIYYEDHGEHRAGQCTVVTETHGPLRGKRVVRGHEAACARFYRRQISVPSDRANDAHA